MSSTEPTISLNTIPATRLTKQMTVAYLVPGVDLVAGVIKVWFLTVVCVLAAGCRFSPMLTVRT